MDLWFVELDRVFQSKTAYEASATYLSFMSFKRTENRNMTDFYIRIWTSLLQNDAVWYKSQIVI